MGGWVTDEQVCLVNQQGLYIYAGTEFLMNLIGILLIYTMGSDDIVIDEIQP